MLQLPLALVDLETTGGNAQRDRITEVGLKILHPDGSEFRWQRLINPGVPIPDYIRSLTGISDEMVADAPAFDSIAAELLDYLDSCLFTAHNARFDYAFLRQAFARCELRFQPKILCTVKLARALYPQWPRHNLDTVCRQMGYRREVSHRAMADIEAMQAFLDYASADQGKNAVEAAAKSQLGMPSLPPHIERSRLDEIPETCGVYRLYDENDNLLYIGKSTSLRSRVLSHFSADHSSAREMKLAQNVHAIDWTVTAGELEALLLENREIKQLLPVYNRRQRRSRQLWYYRLNTDSDGYHHLHEGSWQEEQAWDIEQPVIGLFKTRKAARQRIEALAAEHELCLRRLGLDKGQGACFRLQIGKCRGACLGKESALAFNLRVQQVLRNEMIAPWPHPGPVVITEYNPAYDLSALIVIDRWAHLVTLRDPSELDSLPSTPAAFDHDSYKLLRRWLGRAQAVPVSEMANYGVT